MSTGHGGTKPPNNFGERKCALHVARTKVSATKSRRHFSNEPDTRIVAFLRSMAGFGLMITGAIASLVLLLWFVPALDRLPPPIWSKMTANSALGLLLCTFFFACCFVHCPPRLRWTGAVAAILVLLLGTLTLTEYATHLSLGLDRVLPYNPHSPFAARSSPQTAFGLTMLGIAMLTLRQAKNFWSLVSDIATLMFVGLNLVMLGGYVYGALDLVSFGKLTIMAPHTLAAFFCLGEILIVLRAERGDLFSVFVNVGIGSRIVRLLLPCALAVPFVFLWSETYFRKNGIMGAPYIEAIASASASILAICIVTWMGWRINSLERDLRDQSLTDELTGVYNRRGFYFLGQQAIREAERARGDLTVFFFDLDGLKRVNDMHGHEIGSEMIKAFAGILVATFRHSDILGRVGGDEFAVITIRQGNNWRESIHSRLNQLVIAHNATNGPTYRLSYSIGHAELHPGKAESLEDIITSADAMMYVDKAKKKLAA
jgi:diguanylate cyclase (GGDEF)-like protein